MLSACTGSLPFKKTSLTKFGHSAVGNIPEGPQTFIVVTPAGTAQPSPGKFCEAICISAFHNVAGTLGVKLLLARAPVHTTTTPEGEYPIVHASSATSV